jgi:hypothetical protein
MNSDRLIGIIGIAISTIGVIAGYRTDSLVGWLVLLLGFALMTYAAWHVWIQNPLSMLSIRYSYKFLDPAGENVEVERSQCIRPNTPHVTTLWARSLTTTGESVDFQTNKGSVSVDESTGGGLNVRVDFDRALKKGKDFTWVLRYRGLQCFTSQRESVSYNANQRSPIAEIRVEFHERGIPERAWATRFSDYVETDLGVIEISRGARPTALWSFRPTAGSEYSLHWEMPRHEQDAT